jgi:site-specific DNA-cytosine methylase
MKTIKILLGGSPCTHWSIAQSQNRETAPIGVGWELFRNYLIAKEKFKPDYFLYENNKSAAEPIKAQIRRELGVWSGLPLIDADNGIRFTCINSALVSAQNRERFYVTNFGDVAQPRDRGILLKDILDGADALNEKAYALTAAYGGAVAYNTFERRQRTMCAERVATAESGAVSASDSKQYRVYGTGAKSVTLCGEGGGMGAKTGLYAVDYTGGGYEIAIGKNGIRCVQNSGQTAQGYSVAFTDAKCPALTAGQGAKLKIIENAAQYCINTIGEKSKALLSHYARCNQRHFYPKTPYS